MNDDPLPGGNTSPVALNSDDPMELVLTGVKAGIPLELIKDLLQLRAKIAFDSAMAAATAEMPILKKESKVDYVHKDRGGRTQYDYEDLAVVVGVVAPILGKHGLYHRFEHIVEPQRISVSCVITHKLGHSWRGNPLIGAPDASGYKNPLQAVGSTLTYLSRYALKAALGLAAALDDDAATPNVRPPPQAKTEMPDQYRHPEQSVPDRVLERGKRPDSDPMAAQKHAAALAMSKEEIMAEVEAVAAQGSEAFNKWWYDEANFVSGKRDLVQDSGIGPRLRQLMNAADAAKATYGSETAGDPPAS